MTEPALSSQARLSPGQTAGWALLFVIVLVLVGAFFAYDTAASPVFDHVAVGAAWLLS